MRINVKVIEECGWESALRGMSLSYQRRGDEFNLERATKVAAKLAHKGGGHSKFLESMVVWIDMNVPRHIWSEYDTYRVGTTKQSESTIHTIMRQGLTQEDFVRDVWQEQISAINGCIAAYKNNPNKEDKKKLFLMVKDNLPEGFLQRRIVCTNYKVLQNIVAQRRNHKMPEWDVIIEKILEQVEFPEYLESI